MWQVCISNCFFFQFLFFRYEFSIFKLFCILVRVESFPVIKEINGNKASPIRRSLAFKDARLDKLDRNNRVTKTAFKALLKIMLEFRTALKHSVDAWFNAEEHL
jgi:hypothetical protein